MAQSQITTAFGAANLWIETALGTTLEQVKGSGASIFLVELDNGANPAISYFKAWFALVGGVTLGTTDPDMILPCPASQKLTWLITGLGGVFTTGLTIAGVTTNGTAGTTAPANPFAIKIAYT